MIGGAGSRHRRRRSSPGVHFAQAQQVARLAALNRAAAAASADQGANDEASGYTGMDNEPGQSMLGRRRSSKYEPSNYFSIKRAKVCLVNFYV